MKRLLTTASKPTWMLIVVVYLILATTEVLARPIDAISQAERSQRLQELQHVSFSGKAQEQLDDFTEYCFRSHVKLAVTDAATGASKMLEIELYRPNVNKPVPFVMVVPTIEGVTVLEPKIASTLCDVGMAAAIADVYDTSLPRVAPSWGHEDASMRVAVESLRTVLDFAERDARFDKKKLGVVGLSLGGITSALLAGVEPERLRAVVVAVGGGNLPYVLANSANDKVSELRDFRMGAIGSMSATAYEDELRKRLRYDPMHFASLANKDRILMVMAEKDTKVPTVVQKELFRAFGQPDYMIFAGTHVGTLASLTYVYFDTVVEFLSSRFNGRYGIVAGGRRIQSH